MTALLVDTDLQIAKDAQSAAMKAACQRAIAGGTVSNALGAAHAYPTDDASRADYLAAAVIAGQSGVSDDWTHSIWSTDASGASAFVPHHKQQILQLSQDVVAFTQAKRTICAGLLQQIASAANVEAVKAIVWPSS